MMRREFTSEVVRLEDGMKHHVVIVPEKIAEEFATENITRILLTIDAHRWRRAIQNKRDGRRYVVLGKEMLRQAGVSRGDHMHVTIEQDTDPDHIEMAAEFTAVLEQDPEALARWETFTVGKKRSLALYVSGAKRSETRIKRSLELAEKIRTRTLHGDR